MLGHAWILIVLALVLMAMLSPKWLPALGRRLGRGMRETRDASIDAGTAFKKEVTAPRDDRPGV